MLWALAARLLGVRRTADSAGLRRRGDRCRRQALFVIWRERQLGLQRAAEAEGPPSAV
ncbi:MAG: hypothetical protein WDN48_11620 [Pseudolabrys sp.]